MRILAVMVACGLCATGAVGDTTVTVNGRTFTSSGSSVTVINDTVLVNGAVVSGHMSQGSGKIASEQRDLKPFDGIRLNIDADVKVVKGPRPRCLLTTDDNLLPVITTSWLEGAIEISAEQGFSTRHGIRILIETPSPLGRAEINGAGRLLLEDLLSDRATLTVQGSGDLVAQGRVEDVTVNINGSGSVRASELEAKSVSAIVNGSGHAVVHPTHALSARINGSGDILYRGEPATLRTNVLGSGRIRRD